MGTGTRGDVMSATAVIRSLVRAARSDHGDAALLAATAGGDGAAFAELVRRHGPMVLGVCRRVLGPAPDADDAFQLTFLALVEHARALRSPAALPGWLHRTAFRAAVKLKARRPAPAPADTPEPAVTPDPLADLSWAEVRALLDEELNALPDHLRVPLVLCYLDGRSRDDAAATLGVSLSTLKRRVADGLDRLNRRLTRRGVSGLGLAAAALGGPGLTAQVPTALARQVGTAFGTRAAGVVRACAPLVGWKAVAAVVLVAGGLAAAGAVLVAPSLPAAQPPDGERAAAPGVPKARADAFGDPLPDGAVLRLGSVLFRHAGAADFALLPDGKSALTAGSDRHLRTWDLTTGRETRTVPLAGDMPGRGSLSPGGRYAAGFVGNTITVFDAETGREKASFPVPGRDVEGTFFSPDGGTIGVLTAEPRLTLIEWRTRTQRAVSLPAGPVQPDSSFHGYFSADGRWLVVGSGQWKAVCVFDAATRAEKHRLGCLATRTTVTPDGKALVASVFKTNGQKGTELVTFDLATGRETARFDLGAREYFYSLDVSPDGKTLACGFSDSSCLVDLRNGRILHELSDRPVTVAFTRDGKHVVASTGQKLRVWTAADGKDVFDRPENLGSLPVVTASPDGRWLASADWLDKGVAVWDLRDGRLVRVLAFPGEEGRYVRDLGFSPDGRTLWAGGYTGFVQWWDVATWRELRSAQLDAPVPDAPKPNFLYRVRVTPDGKTAAALARVRRRPTTTGLAVWDIASGEVKGLRSLPAEQRQWAWAGDGSAVALSTPDGLVVADGTDPSRTRFTVPGVTANAPLAFSPDGRLVAARKTAGREPNAGEVIVVEVTTGGVAAVVKTGPVDHLALTADGRTLVAAGADSVQVYNTAGGERGRRPLPAPATELLLPDDRRAVTAHADGTGLVWDLTAFSTRPLASSGAPAALWDVLAGPDAAAAHRAGWELVDRPAEAVTFLRDKLKPVRPADEAAVKALVAKLDAPDFAEREAATKALQALGAAAAPTLRSALQGAVSAERADRATRLLAVLNTPVVPPGDRLREVRAVAVLERIGTADARALLGELARGMSDARLTREAAAAVARLAGRSRRCQGGLGW